MKTILKPPPPPPYTHTPTLTLDKMMMIFSCLLHNNFISTKKLCRLSWNTSKSLSLDFHTDNAHISICCLCIIVRDLRSYIITAKSFLDLRLLQTLGVLEEKKVRVITRKHSLQTWNLKLTVHRLSCLLQKGLWGVWGTFLSTKLAEIQNGKQMEQTISGISFQNFGCPLLGWPTCRSKVTIELVSKIKRYCTLV